MHENGRYRGCGMILRSTCGLGDGKHRCLALKSFQVAFFFNPSLHCGVMTSGKFMQHRRYVEWCMQQPTLGPCLVGVWKIRLHNGIL